MTESPCISCEFNIILEQATFLQMNLQQILNKESLDELLQRKDGIEGGTLSGDDQMDLVARYLDLKISPQLDLDQYPLVSNNFYENNASSCQSPSETAPRPSNRKKGSVFHNFQKHLVTTLKTEIKIRKISHSNKSQSNIASQLWDYLKNSSKICKRFLLCLLVGRGHREEEAIQQKYYQDYSQMIRELNEYSEKEINSAQQYMRREVIRQSRRLLQSNSFEGRRMNHSEDFKLYFKKFIDELQIGKISRRMVKSSKADQKRDEGHSSLSAIIYNDQK